MADMSPPELMPTIPKSATPQQCIAMWADLVNACDQFLLAGLRREIGPEGDFKAAYRQWLEERREDHDRALMHMMEELERREGRRAG